MLLFCNIFLLTYFNIKIFDIILLGSQFQAPLPIWKFPSPPAERAGGGGAHHAMLFWYEEFESRGIFFWHCGIMVIKSAIIFRI